MFKLHVMEEIHWVLGIPNSLKSEIFFQLFELTFTFEEVEKRNKDSTWY